MKRYYHAKFDRSESREEAKSRLPERKLLLAVLKRAVLDFISGDKCAAEDARAWIFEDASANDQFTFPWVIEQLDLDHRQIVDQIERLSKDRATTGYGELRQIS